MLQAVITQIMMVACISKYVHKLIITACIVCLSLLIKPYLYGIQYQQTDFLPSSKRMHHGPAHCRGHYHLCTLKRMITETKLYGDTTFNSSDIYDLSKLGGFCTSYYKQHEGRTLGPKKIYLLRSYIRDEFRNPWLNKTLQWIEFTNATLPEQHVSCSPSLFKYFDYTFNITGFKKTYPQRIVFTVREKRKESKSFYPYLLPTIYVEISSPKTKAFCDTESTVQGIYTIELF